MANVIIGYLEFPDGKYRPIYDNGRCQRLIDEDTGEKAWRLYMVLGDEGCDPPHILPVDARSI